VPAGEFLMGAAAEDALAKDHEKPQHQVYVSAFWIDQTEVTNSRFFKCLEAGVCQPTIYEIKAQTYVPYAVDPQYQNYPALLYESEVAAAYCQWAGRRLPTEAEWEKAARGIDGRLYVWGNAPLSCELTGYNTCRYLSPTPRPAGVGTHAVNDYAAGASVYGALNMAGNVWEWVADWYSPTYYARSPAENPIGPASGEYRVRRGGGNESVEGDLRVTARASGEPEHYFDGQMGFRCAMSDVP
jgi:formylglycine-generating enzyme required for sulfatase activity